MLPAGYRGLDDVEAAMRGFAGVEIGRSVEGRPLYAAAFGPPEAPVASFVIAGLHAIEWIGVETALALAQRLAVDPPRERRAIVVALANPDGYARIETDLRAGVRKWRRTNARGVDLNRNWATEFRPRAKKWALWNWPGEHPFSEPEVAAVVKMLDLVAANGVRIDTALSLHSFGRKLLLPWGGRFGRSERYRQLKTRALAVQARLGERYTIDQVSRWLPGAFAFGIEIDDLHARYGACALLVECSIGGLSIDPRTWLAPFRWYNPPQPAVTAADIAGAVDNFVRGA